MGQLWAGQDQSSLFGGESASENENESESENASERERESESASDSESKSASGPRNASASTRGAPPPSPSPPVPAPVKTEAFSQWPSCGVVGKEGMCIGARSGTGAGAIKAMGYSIRTAAWRLTVWYVSRAVI